MKYPKIVSLTLANGLGFLVFGSILAGCQKAAIQKKGFFTNLDTGINRHPASVESGFSAFQDSKQIFIYCQLSDLNPKNCYNRNLEESVKEYGLKKGAGENLLAKIKSENSFESAKAKTEYALKHVFMAIQPSINSMVENRAAFCEKNANVYLKRCLKQYVKKETFQVLNAYQKGNSAINGHEYLYLKTKIEQNYLSRLNIALGRLKKAQKKKL